MDKLYVTDEHQFSYIQGVGIPTFLHRNKKAGICIPAFPFIGPYRPSVSEHHLD